MHRIDPRIVIIQIVLSGICAFWIFKPLAMLCEVIFLMSFLLYLQHPKEALRLGVWFAFLVGLYALLNESNAPQIISFLRKALHMKWNWRHEKISKKTFDLQKRKQQTFLTGSAWPNTPKDTRYPCPADKSSGSRLLLPSLQNRIFLFWTSRRVGLTDGICSV